MNEQTREEKRLITQMETQVKRAGRKTKETLKPDIAVKEETSISQIDPIIFPLPTNYFEFFVCWFYLHEEFKKEAKFYGDIFENILDIYEEANPEFLEREILQMFRGAVLSLKTYIEDPQEKEVTWEDPLVLLQYPIDYHRYSQKEKEGFFSYFQFSHSDMKTDKKAEAIEMTEKLIEGLYKTKEAFVFRHLSNDLASLGEGDKRILLIPRELLDMLQELPEEKQKEIIDKLTDTPVLPLGIKGTVTDKDTGKKTEFTGTFSIQVNPLAINIKKEITYYPVLAKLEIKGTNPSNWSNEDRQELWETMLKQIDEITPEEKFPQRPFLSLSGEPQTPVKSDMPAILPEYIKIPGNILYPEVQRVFSIRDFIEPGSDNLWYKKTIEKNSVKAIIELRPDNQVLRTLDEESITFWQEKIAEKYLSMGDLTADVFDVMIYNWLRKARDEKHEATITVNDILKMRGIKPQKSGTGRRGGYQKRQRQKIAEQISLLDNTWVNILSMDVYSEEEKHGKRRRKKKKLMGVEGKAIEVSLRYGQMSLDGHMEEVYEWEYRIGKAFLPFIFGVGRQITLISIKALQFNPKTEEEEKRLTRYLSWQWRIRQSRGNYTRPFKVSTLLEAIGGKVDKKHPNRTKNRLEKALDKLQETGIIAGWQYDSEFFDESIIGKPGWWKKWLQWGVIIEPPNFITDKYQEIKIYDKGKKRKKLPPPKDTTEFNITKLREERKRRGLTLMQASESIGIALSTLSMYERGSKKPGHKTMKKIKKWWDKK